jgi:hypothetical protein
VNPRGRITAQACIDVAVRGQVLTDDVDLPAAAGLTRNASGSGSGPLMKFSTLVSHVSYLVHRTQLTVTVFEKVCSPDSL